MKSSKGMLVRSVLSAVVLAASGAALAEESSGTKDLSVTLGFKAWASEWQTTGGFNSARATAYTPSVTVKYKDWFASAGVMQKTNYTQTDSFYGITQTVARQETDVSVGYYVHPQVGIMLGYKTASQDWGAGAKVTWKIPSIGLSLSAPIQETKLFMFGNAAFGKASISAPANFISGATNVSGGLYTTAELGLGYSLTQSFRMTAGYKYQALPYSYDTPVYAFNGLGFVQTGTMRATFLDATRGVTLGASYTF